MSIYKVTLIKPDGKRHILRVGDNQHIFEVAFSHGLDLPHSCLQGWCCSCATRVIEGEVDQQDSRRFYEQDRKAGFALICTGKPKSDLVLRTHANEEMRSVRKKNNLPCPRGKWGQDK